jgi:hypothetical protein
MKSEGRLEGPDFSGVGRLLQVFFMIFHRIFQVEVIVFMKVGRNGGGFVRQRI